MSTTETLAKAATDAAGQGRWQEAEQLWKKVLSIEPRHPGALYSVGVHAFKRGDLAEARSALQAAQTVAPHDPVIALSLSVVFRQLGDSAAELNAINATLVADQYFLPGLLAKADYLERHGSANAAAATYRNALRVAPPQAHWPAALREQLQHAARITERHSLELTAFLSERMGRRLSSLTPVEVQRWREAGAIVSGRSKPYFSQCNRLHVPRLPAIPFFERAAFDWVESLEARTSDIAAELTALLAEDEQAFKPYVAYEAGAPVNQWKELNHSKRWSSYFLWRNGRPVPESLLRCPRTAEALASVGMAEIDGLCPNAMFSVLAPHTHIPPHHGETNARVIVHLPLIVPDGCVYRVGFEQRQWEVGQALIFDDSIEHEARNDSDEPRVVLIFDVWNPLLSPGERDMVEELSAAIEAFQSQK